MENIVFYWCSFHVFKSSILRDDQKMEQKKSYEIDMCNGPILSKMLLFTIPLMCSSMLQLLFNAADIVVVGRYAGDNSLAAVGSNTSDRIADELIFRTVHWCKRFGGTLLWSKKRGRVKTDSTYCNIVKYL